MRVKKAEYLPTALTKAVKGVFNEYREKRSKNNVLSIVGLIFHKNIINPFGSDSYVPLSAEYWKKMIGSHYSPYLKKLIHHKVIESKWVRYIPNDGKGESVGVMGYRINPEYLNSDFSMIKYIDNVKHTSVEMIEDVDLKLMRLPLNLTKGFQQHIKMLKEEALIWLIDNASELVNKSINSDFINGLPSDMPVKIRILDDNGSFYEQYRSVESAKQIAQKQGKEIFYYKDMCIVADKPQFIDATTRNVIFHYTWHIKTFDSNHLNLKRNKKTLRVYSQITSLPSALLPFIRMSNNYLMQADLKCSQFTIFANILNLYISNKNGDRLVNLFEKKQTKEFIKKLVTIFRKYDEIMPENGLNYNNPQENDNDIKNNDISKFIVDVLLHDFYERLKIHLKLPQRAHAKTIAFRTVFSHPKNSNYFVVKFDEVYHDVLSIINDFKTKYGYNKFAIGLQNVESEIFVDKIWAQTIISGINTFTRHDSVLFSHKRKDEVLTIIKNAFDELKFINLFNHEWFNEESWESFVFEKIYGDSMEMEPEDGDVYFFPTHEPIPLLSIAKKEDNNIVKDDNGVEDDNGFDVKDHVEINDNIDSNNNDKNDDMTEYNDFDEYDYEDITVEYFLNNVRKVLKKEEITLPKKIREDYFGHTSVELLRFLCDLQGIRNNIQNALQDDIGNLVGKLENQIPSYQPETNNFITHLIKLYEEN